MEDQGMADIAVLQQRVKTLESSDTEQWRLLDRLPNWAVWVMTAGGAVIGFEAHWLMTCLK